MTRFPRFPVILFVGIPWWIALPFLILALYLYLAIVILWALVLGFVVGAHAIVEYVDHRGKP